LKTIKVIDLFAGPGGLGEGLTGFTGSKFDIALSVEKDKDAHATLTLRSFFRRLVDKSLYVKYVNSTGETARTSAKKEMISAHSEEWQQANAEVLNEPSALGNPLIFEKWKNGDVPTDEDFEKETESQKRIKDKILAIIQETGRTPYKTPKEAEPLVVVGGPPCQAYSKIGRARRAGIADHNPDHDERFFLYKEYANVIAMARPDLFIMENVDGIGSAKLADGSTIFPKILERLTYLVDTPTEEDEQIYRLFPVLAHQDKRLLPASEEKDFLVLASDFGVPQKRKRVVIIGIRADLVNEDFSCPVMNSSKTDSPSLVETLSSLPAIRSYISPRKSNKKDSRAEWIKVRNEIFRDIKKLITPPGSIDLAVEAALKWERRTIQSEKIMARNKKLPAEEDKELICVENIDREPITDLENDKIESNRTHLKALFEKIYPLMKAQISHLKQSERSVSEGNNHSMANHDGGMNAIQSSDLKRYEELNDWLSSGLPLALNHNAKSHMNDDLKRYFFTALWTLAASTTADKVNDKVPASPLTKHFPTDMASAHKSWYSHKFQDRFRSHDPSGLANTLTAHMHKDGHANIHYDPMQCRSLSVREAARLQTFPDDYFFEGGQSAQFKQVGNAVPPFLAAKIGKHIQSILDALEN
jgi:DNA (cytosine-5)-methyltransferase 1